MAEQKNLFESKPHYRVLTLHGGGIRGIINARILQELEEKSGKPITELFDYIIGTSIGGIIAAGLTVPSDEDKTKPKYNASYMVNLLEKEARTVFPEPSSKSASTFFLTAVTIPMIYYFGYPYTYLAFLFGAIGFGTAYLIKP